MRSFVHGTLRFILLAMGFGLFSLATQAQSTRSKAKPLATPPPALSGAEIISQAGDFVEPTIVMQQPEQKSSDKAPTTNSAARIRELTERINKLESTRKSDYDEKQKRMLLNLDILTRAEQRSESLRKQLFEMIEKENTVKTRIDQLENDSRPEMIERSSQLAGSLRPEEIRENRRKSLLAEKTNLQTLLTEIQSTRANLAVNLDKAEIMVGKLRTKLEKDIDDSFLKDDPQN